VKNTDANIENSLELSLAFDKRGGLIPVVVQEAATGQILMLAYANHEAIKTTIETQKATFYSTSRKEVWTKGLTSGDELRVLNIFTDCDQDALIYQVELLGNGACHTKNKAEKTRISCFYRVFDFEQKKLENLDQ
jgi:phosphoribosyl-AMP cyclohydrolase